MMTREKTTFYIEGPDWINEVEIDTSLFDDDRSQLLEAGTMALEKQLKISEDMNLGAIILIRKGRKNAKEAMVNSYICLNNAGQYKIAENLRVTFKDATGQDLSVDAEGFSY